MVIDLRNLTPQAVEQVANGIAQIAHALSDGTFDGVRAKIDELMSTLDVSAKPDGSPFTADDALAPALRILEKTGGIPPA